MVVNMENLLSWNPDIIVMWYNEKKDPAHILHDPQWQTIKAVKEGKVYEFNDIFHSDLWTLKFQHAARIVAKWCHPEAFRNMDLEGEKKKMWNALYGSDTEYVDAEKTIKKDILFYLIPIPLAFCSLLVGPSDLVSARHIWEWAVNGIFQTGFVQNYDKELIEAVVLNTRLPRIILALLIGASLSASGTTLQALFRNPLVSPDILGLSSGAAFGAALAFVVPYLPVQPMAFIFGLVAAALSYVLAVKNREISTVSLSLQVSSCQRFLLHS